MVAVPVDAPETCAELHTEADELLCPTTPKSFRDVGQFYEYLKQRRTRKSAIYCFALREAERRSRELPTRRTRLMDLQPSHVSRGRAEGSVGGCP